MRKIALSIVCSLVIAMGGFYWTVVRPALAGVTCSLPFTLTNGTIADATQVMANYNALVTCLSNAAAAGANNDITSLSGLTTPITPNEGGSNVYIGSTPTTSGSELVIASTTPANYSNTRGYTVIFTAVATNVSIQSLSVNGQSIANIFKQSTSGPVPLSGGEIVPNQQYSAIFDGTQFQINPVPSLALGWGLQAQTATLSGINLTNPPYGFDTCVNMTISATVGSNLLGLQLFAADTGAAPTAQHPILCPWRNGTIATGSPVWTSIVTPTYLDTNAAGASLGTLNGMPFRLWVVLFYNGGTPTLGLWQSTTFQVAAQAPQGNNITLSTLDESALQSPTAISAAATSAGVYYAPNGTSISNSPFRILGYLDFGNGLTTAGNYATGPTRIQLFGPGIKKPGDRINFVKSSLATATALVAATYNITGTKPVPTNGVTATSITVSPTASMDVFNINASVSLNGAGPAGTGFIYDGSTSVAVAGNSISTAGAFLTTIPLNYATVVTAASRTFTLYGTTNSGSLCLNAIANACLALGGVTSWISAEEIQP